MATGMISSAHNLDKLPVLRSGELITTSMKVLKDPNARTYKHMIPGAKFVMPDGLEIQFLGGHFSTTDADIISELDKIANKSASMIYTVETAKEANLQLNKQVAEDAAANAATN